MNKPKAQSKTTALRGLAIITVVVIHIMAFFPNLYRNQISIPIAASLDQLLRVGVPLFVVLSGFGLSMKYQTTTFNLVSFVKKRVFTILIPYLIWSIFSFVVLNAVPAWKYETLAGSLLTQIFLGQADYQLYFIPMLIQLYVLFPILRITITKWPSPTVLLAISTQLIMFSWLQTTPFVPFLPTLSLDRLAYIFGFSWIGYFVLGMWIATHKLSTSQTKLCGITALTALIFQSWNSSVNILNGIDPLLALSFTQWPIFVYASAASLFLTSKKSIPLLMEPILSQIGSHAFTIFLSHTIGLRLLYALIMRQLPLQQFVVVLTAWLALTLFTIKKLHQR